MLKVWQDDNIKWYKCNGPNCTNKTGNVSLGQSLDEEHPGWKIEGWTDIHLCPVCRVKYKCMIQQEEWPIFVVVTSVGGVMSYHTDYDEAKNRANTLNKNVCRGHWVKEGKIVYNKEEIK